MCVQIRLAQLPYLYNMGFSLFYRGLLALPSFGFAQAILTVTTSERAKDFTLDELLALPQTVVVTANDYVDPPAAFQGPLLRALLEISEIDRDAELKMIALNDFTSTVPLSLKF